MPWCPKCRYEYVPQLTRCPECGAELVAELPPEETTRVGEGEGFEQEFLGTALGEPHAALIKQALAAEGIPCRMQLGGIPDFAYPGRIPMLPIGIYVNRRDLARAQEIYRAYEQPPG